MKKILILFLCLPCLLIQAQRIENSPYTRYGLGEIILPTIASYRSMGHTSIAQADRYQGNIGNVASFASLGATAFDCGANVRYIGLKENAKTSQAWGGSLDYLSIAFPLKNPLNELYESKKPKYRLGMGFALSRMSRINYNIQGIDSTADIGVFYREYSGLGGLYKATWGNAIQVKNFNFGLGLNYIFGNTNTKSKILFEDLDYAFNPSSDRKLHTNAFSLDLGALYSIELNTQKVKDNPSLPLRVLRLGLIANPGAGFTSYKDEINITTQIVGSGTLVDTLSTTTYDKKGKGNFGGDFGLGLTFVNGEKSGYSVEYKIGTWSNYYNENTNETKGSLVNSSHFGIGGYFRPDYKSYSSFWKRAFYKYGFYYDQDPRKVLDKNITAYGFTAGVGLPFSYQRKVAQANIGLELGRRGSGTIVSEQYLKFNVGFSFNDDEWFIKRKYN